MNKAILLLLAGAAASHAAWAAGGEMKPGLWELTVKSDAFKDMPRLPPEQLEQMRRMGVNVPRFSGAGVVSKVCITPQMAQQAPGLERMENGCRPQNFRRSGNGYSADIVCTGALQGSGKVSGTFAGDDRFTSLYEFKGTMNGATVDHRQESSGRWLSGDCGGVRPIGG